MAHIKEKKEEREEQHIICRERESVCVRVNIP